jgi:hypothetical protein
MCIRDRAWIDDYDGDGTDDLLLGAPYMYNSRNKYSGGASLFYGRNRTNWNKVSVYTDGDLFIEGMANSYIGYAYGQSLGSGDFNNDGQADILCGGYYTQVKGIYGGAAFMILTQPPVTTVNSFRLLDGDGEDGKTICAEAGGTDIKGLDPVGDGFYTFTGNYSDSWTVYEVREIRLVFDLTEEYVGTSYIIGYNPRNETFYIIDNPGDGIVIDTERCSFEAFGSFLAEVRFTVGFKMSFLNQAPVDTSLVLLLSKEDQIMKIPKLFHVEKDLTFSAPDMKVTKGTDVIERGDFFAGGEDLTMSGLRVIYEDTDVSPLDDKFFLRVTDSYSRVFENHTSSGKEIFFKIPTNVESGEYRFWIEIIMYYEWTRYAEVKAIVPPFYVTMDFDGPLPPQNLLFHADSVTDPENRWDNDEQVWLTWDQAFDSQVQVYDYEYILDGPGTFSATGTVSNTSMELALGPDGEYTISIWGIDEVGNPGARAIASIVKDSTPIDVLDPYPTYEGNVWYNTRFPEVKVTFRDTLVGLVPPQIDLSTLRYAVTGSNTPPEGDDVWMIPEYRVLSSATSGNTRTISIAAFVEAVEGTENHIWWKVMDEAGNIGMTTYTDPVQLTQDYGDVLDGMNVTGDLRTQMWEEYNETTFRFAMAHNPSNLWIDVTPLTFSGETPSDEPRDENMVTASIIISDDNSGVDASTIQYSVSRNGINNYGGWTSALLNEDGETVIANTVAPILLEHGSANYIRWRAKDVAGNGYFVSGDFQINVIPRPTQSLPVAKISNPTLNQVSTTKDQVQFDGTESFDPDPDTTLTYTWIILSLIHI